MKKILITLLTLSCVSLSAYPNLADYPHKCEKLDNGATMLKLENKDFYLHRVSDEEFSGHVGSCSTTNYVVVVKDFFGEKPICMIDKDECEFASLCEHFTDDNKCFIFDEGLLLIAKGQNRLICRWIQPKKPSE